MVDVYFLCEIDVGSLICRRISLRDHLQWSPKSQIPLQHFELKTTLQQPATATDNRQQKHNKELATNGRGGKRKAVPWRSIYQPVHQEVR